MSTQEGGHAGGGGSVGAPNSVGVGSLFTPSKQEIPTSDSRQAYAGSQQKTLEGSSATPPLGADGGVTLIARPLPLSEHPVEIFMGSPVAAAAPGGEREEPPRDSCMCTLAILVLAWSAVSLIFAFHWLVLCYWLWRERRAPARGRQLLHAAAHVASYWVASIVLAWGGTWCRSSGVYVPCVGEEEMSHACLFEQQPLEYQRIYIIHYVALAWMVAHWAIDLGSIPFWAADRSRGDRLSLLGACTYMASWQSWCVVSVATGVVTLTWLGLWTDWSTETGLGGLALCLLGEIAAVALAAAGLLRLWDRRVALKAARAHAPSLA